MTYAAEIQMMSYNVDLVTRRSFTRTRHSLEAEDYIVSPPELPIFHLGKRTAAATFGSYEHYIR